jgi:hypothetical protein
MADAQFAGPNARTSPSQLQAYAARSLHLLRDIEQTLFALDTECKALDAFSTDADRLLAELEGAQLGRQLDPEQRICRLFVQAEETAERVHAGASRRKAAAIADARLHHEDGVVDAYDDFLEAVARYHNALSLLRERVAVHDALLSPRGAETYTDAAALMSDIRAKR